MGGAIRITKIKRFFRLLGWQIETDVLSVVSAPKSAFAALFGIFFFWLAFKFLGVEWMIAEAPIWMVQAASILLAAICLLALVIVTAPLRVLRNEKLRGTWIGNQFVYHTPQHAFTAQWTTADNGTGKRFVFDHVEPNSLVQYNIDVDGGGDRVVTGLNFKHWELPLFTTGGQQVRSTGGKAKVRTNAKREFILFADSLPDTSPVIIRVYILSFEVGN